MNYEGRHLCIAYNICMGAISSLYVLWGSYPLCCLMVEEKKQ